MTHRIIAFKPLKAALMPGMKAPVQISAIFDHLDGLTRPADVPSEYPFLAIVCGDDLKGSSASEVHPIILITLPEEDHPKSAGIFITLPEEDQPKITPGRNTVIALPRVVHDGYLQSYSGLTAGDEVAFQLPDLFVRSEYDGLRETPPEDHAATLTAELVECGYEPATEQRTATYLRPPGGGPVTTVYYQQVREIAAGMSATGD